MEEGKYVRGQRFVRAAKRFTSPGGKILDYGCGPGRISVLLARSGFRVQGIDPAPGMLKEAAAQDLTGLAVEFALVPREGPSLRVADFDSVVCSSVIEYVPSAADLLAAFRRALRPHGVLIISYANRLSLWRKYAKWRSPQSPHLTLQSYVWNFNQIRGELSRAGLGAGKSPRTHCAYFGSLVNCQPSAFSTS